jgi:hypothetical protein
MENLDATGCDQSLALFPRDGDRVFRVVDTDHLAKAGEGSETLECSTATAPDVENRRGISNLHPGQTPTRQPGMPDVHAANKESAEPSARHSTLEEQSAKQVHLSS